MSGARDFVHLHLHTEYSLLDGASRPVEVAQRAADWGMEAVALTDHGNLYGVVPFYNACKTAGVKPIIGVEAYILPEGSRFDRTRIKKDEGKGLCHFTLLCQNETGYRNLLKIVSDSWLHGFYYKPRMDRELLTGHTEGLIAMSACLGGEIPQALLADNVKRATAIAYEYRELFGPDNFYLELMDHHTPEQQQVNRMLVDLHRETGIPLVATNDVHYVEESDADPQDLLLCIQTGCIHSDPNRWRMSSRELFMRSADQMWDMFAELPQALLNTREIADRCNLKLKFGDLILPEFPNLPAGQTAASYLRQLCYERVGRFYSPVTAEVRERLDYELGVIDQKGYSDYFLIVWDLIDFAKRKGMRVGPGRGSAAGAIVAYVLGITELDPLRYGLFFERFLNPERPSPPDIDIDFPPERREEVVAYTIEQYGVERTAKIITFGTLGARAAIKDVGRVLEYPIPEVNELSALVPDKPGTSLQEALEQPELKQRYETDPRVAHLLDSALRLEGLSRHTSVHAAAMVIAPDSIDNYVPLCKVSGGDGAVTQFDMGAIEKCGLLKMDFLGLRTMTVIDEACRVVAATTGNQDFDVRTLPMDDKRTYDLISRGDVVGVFQLESGGFQRVCKDLRPDCIEDIVALVALYRPGPMDNIPEYIARKHGQSPIVYKHPLLEPILQETYGIIVYQEQVMQIGRDLGGFTLAGADAIRKAVGKKDAVKMAEVRRDFIAGAAAQGITEQVSNDLMDEIEAFARYAFNKAHSACYAVVAYWTAYLKANHPREFMAAQLTSVMDKRDKIVTFINDTRAMSIEVRPPCINTGGVVFEVHEDHIVYGLAAINGVGHSVAQAIYDERAAHGPYRDLYDFCCRVDLKAVPKAALDKLIKAGACRSLGNRHELLLSYEAVYEAAARTQQDQRSGQISLFDGFDDADSGSALAPSIKPSAEFSLEELRGLDTELLGLVVFEDPFAELRKQLLELDIAESATPSNEVEELATDAVVLLAGHVETERVFQTRRGEASRVRLTDLWGNVTLLLWSTSHDAYSHLCTGAEVRVVMGKVKRDPTRPGPPEVVVDQIQKPSEWKRKRRKPTRDELNGAQRLVPPSPAPVRPTPSPPVPEREAEPAEAKTNGAKRPGEGPLNGTVEPRHPAPRQNGPLRVTLHVPTGELQDADLRRRLARLAETLRSHPGDQPVVLLLQDGPAVRRLRLSQDFATRWSDSLQSAMQSIEGCSLVPAN